MGFILIAIWIVSGLIAVIIGIRQAEKDGVSKAPEGCGPVTNEILNFIVVGIMLVFCIALGPFSYVFCIRKVK